MILKIELAKKEEDFALRKILHQNEMEGNISITYQRNPSYFSALKVEGIYNQVIVARNKKINKIVGFGTRSIKSVYVNGKVQTIGYLSNLRVNKGYRGKGVLSKGYSYLKKLHQDKKVPIYYSTILEGNKIAISVLTSKKFYLPSYHDIGRYCGIVVNLFKKKKEIKHNFKIIRGSEEILEKIVNFLNKKGTNKQFYPYYTKKDFLSKNKSLIDFNIKDFYVAVKEDKILGVIGKWDQRNFKQIIITEYKGKMKLIKPFYNALATIIGFSSLPKPNSQLNFFYVSFIAIEKNDPQVFRALIQELYNDSLGKGYSHFLVGLYSKDPLLKVVEEYNHIKFNGRLYVVCWEDGENFFKGLDNRVPYIEFATL